MYDLIEATWLTPRGKPATFRHRTDTNDHNSITSTMHPHDEYHTADKHPKAALDIGGYLGTVGIGIAIDNPLCDVLIVEPVPWNAELIRANAELNGVSNRVTLFEGAIGPPGITSSEIRFGYRGDPNLEHHAFVGNTSLSYDTGGDTPHDAIQVETLGIAALLDRFGFAPDWCKIDCEGGEWAFFDAPSDDLKRLPFITGELHPVRGHAMTDIVALLPTHDVMIDGLPEGPCAFTAIIRG